MKNWLARRGALPITAYLLALAAWLVLGAAHFGSDALAKAQGRLAEETMAVTDWQLVGLTQNADGTLTTVDGDPQMILENVDGRVVRTISYTAQFDGEAREMCLYYTTKVGEDYSPERGRGAVHLHAAPHQPGRAAAGPLQPRGKQDRDTGGA